MDSICTAPRHDGEAEPAAPHARLCHPCRAALRRDLRRMPVLDGSLEDLLDPRRSGTGHGGSGGDGLPYHEQAAECRSQIRHDLEVWVLRITGERQPDAWPARTVPAMAAWLAGWSPWCAYRPWAGDMAGAFAADRGRAMALIDPHPAAAIPIPRDVSWCPRCGASGTLTATVYQSEGDLRESVIACTACAHEWEPSQWMRLGKTLTAWRDRQTA